MKRMYEFALKTVTCEGMNETNKNLYIQRGLVYV